MAISVDSIMLQVMPLVKTILYLIVGLGSVLGLGYYLFIVRRRRVWQVNLWEQKADGRIHLIGKDRVIERKINKGKQIVFMLQKHKIEVFPPPWESTYRLFGKEYTDYLRVREDDFIPMRKELSFNPGKTTEEKKAFFEKIRGKIHDIRKKSPKDVEKEYIFLPINNQLTADMKYEIMDYDVNMMRINAIDNRDKIYADKLDWMSKYGQFLALGMIIVLIIVVLYLSYDYSANILEAAMGKAEQTLSMVEQLAAKMGGTPPPS